MIFSQLKDTLFAKLFALSALNAFAAVVSYALTIALANFLGPAEFGTYSYILVTAAFVTIVVTFASDQIAPTALARGVDPRVIFRSVTFLRLGFLLITVAAVTVIYWDEPLILIGVLCLLPTNLNLAYVYELQSRNVRYAVIYVLERGVYVGLSFLFIFLEIMSVELLLATIFCVLSVSVSLQLFDQRSYIIRGRLFADGVYSYCVKNGFPIVVVAMASFAYGGLSRLVLGENLGVEQLGIFSAGWQLITIGTIFQGQVTKLWRVPLSAAVNDRNMRGVLLSLRSYFFLATMPLIALCAVFTFGAEIIVAVLFGADYASMTQLLPVFGLYLVVISAASLLEILWVALHRNYVYASINVLLGLAFVGILWLWSTNLDMVDYAVLLVGFHFFACALLTIGWIICYRQRALETP